MDSIKMVSTTLSTAEHNLNPKNTTNLEEITPGDAAWILSNAFLILTMQSGFGLLEAGFVSIKNVTNILVKNLVDVCLGGITYWSFGYGLSFGEPSNAFCGWGHFFATAPSPEVSGTFYTHYVFHFTFATAATTIVSGAVAERMKFKAYMLFSMLNTFIYCLPASWVWNKAGFLHKLGFYDFAGSCVVHMTGGCAALVGAAMLGPRQGRFDPDSPTKKHFGLTSPVTGLTGTFMLWWAWLAFNCGSTYAVEGNAWKTAAKVALNTLNGSIAGGIVALTYSLVISRGKVVDVTYLITGILGGLVGITGGCSVYTPAYSLVVGGLSASVAIVLTPTIARLGIDDPVGAIPVHLGSAAFSTLSVGLFAVDDLGELPFGRNGLAGGGGFEQFGIQLLGMSIICIWSFSCTIAVFGLLWLTTGIRVSAEEEAQGADWYEHNIKHQSLAAQLEVALVNAIHDMHEDTSFDMDNFMTQFVHKMIDVNDKTSDAIRHMPSEEGTVVQYSAKEAAEQRRMTLQSIQRSASQQAHRGYTNGHVVDRGNVGFIDDNGVNGDKGVKGELEDVVSVLDSPMRSRGSSAAVFSISNKRRSITETVHPIVVPPRSHDRRSTIVQNHSSHLPGGGFI